MWPGGMWGEAAGGGGGPPTMTASAAQPVSSASAPRRAPMDAPPVRFLIWNFLLTAAVNSKAPGKRRTATPRAPPTGKGSLPDRIQLQAAVLLLTPSTCKGWELSSRKILLLSTPLVPWLSPSLTAPAPPLLNPSIAGPAEKDQAEKSQHFVPNSRELRSVGRVNSQHLAPLRCESR